MKAMERDLRHRYELLGKYPKSKVTEDVQIIVAWKAERETIRYMLNRYFNAGIQSRPRKQK